MEAIVNLTPHTITLYTSGHNIPYPSRGEARVTSAYRPAKGIYRNGAHIPMKQRDMFTTGLPEPDGETMYIVSQLVAAANPHRDDLLTPSDFVRDMTGRIIGCQCFARPRVITLPGELEIQIA